MTDNPLLTGESLKTIIQELNFVDWCHEVRGRPITVATMERGIVEDILLREESIG